jgi:hypothetical protein
MGKKPLRHHMHLRQIINWLDMKGKNHISDISSWNTDTGDWIGWNLPNIPSNLQDAAHQIQTLLKGCAPIHITLKYKRGWGNGNYSVKKGYSQLLSQTTLLPKDKMWNSLWTNDSPPKVNSFCWILAHGKLLTRENMLKINMYGPFRCELCGKASETSQHVFLLCPFTITMWKIALQSLHPRIRWSVQPRKIFLDWASQYRGTFRNPLFKDLFKALPKFICWKIWLARNRIMFSNLRSPTDLVAKKVVGLLAEVFISKFKAFPFTPTSTIESDWISSFFLPPSPTSPLPPPSRSTWQLDEDIDYLCWHNKQ